MIGYKNWKIRTIVTIVFIYVCEAKTQQDKR